jgi:hypothetical protein
MIWYAEKETGAEAMELERKLICPLSAFTKATAGKPYLCPT